MSYLLYCEDCQTDSHSYIYFDELETIEKLLHYWPQMEAPIKALESIPSDNDFDLVLDITINYQIGLGGLSFLKYHGEHNLSIINTENINFRKQATPGK